MKLNDGFSPNAKKWFKGKRKAVQEKEKVAYVKPKKRKQKNKKNKTSQELKVVNINYYVAYVNTHIRHKLSVKIFN